MRMTISNQIDIQGAPEPLLRKIRDTFTIKNPAWLENKKMGRWQGQTGRWLTFYKGNKDGISIPRGAMGLLLFFCKAFNIRYHIIDQRRSLPEPNIQFDGTLSLGERLQRPRILLVAMTPIPLIRSFFIDDISVYVIAIIENIMKKNLEWQILRSFEKSIIMVENSLIKIAGYTIFLAWKTPIIWPFRR